MTAAPFGGLLLADLGAEVIRIDRPPGEASTAPILDRGKKSVALDLKAGEAVELLLRLVEDSDVLIDPFRPGVAERLGIGPDTCLERNRRLIYGRLTGWGQTGPWASHAGHDINYIALAGPLAHIGTLAAPSVPLNLVGDMGGGGMLLAFGIVSALFERERSGLGQVVDSAMVDGAALLMAGVFEFAAVGKLDGRGQNLVDGGAPHYSVYECADGKFVSIGAFEPKFLARLCEIAGIDDQRMALDRPLEFRDRLTAMFQGRSRDEWAVLLECETELCFAPVLEIDELPEHPHLKSREIVTVLDGLAQPSPAPRFGRTPARIRAGAPEVGRDTYEVLGERLGLPARALADLEATGVIGSNNVPASRLPHQ
jgi:alpha-methylacyl-CoA racemase